MDAPKVFPEVLAVHNQGVLKLLDPLDLPDGASVRLFVESVSSSDAGHSASNGLVYPTRFVSVESLEALIGLVAVGGDALADSEALYDPDWD